MEVIRLIIADDSDFVRDGMRVILGMDQQFEVVGCAANGLEAVELARKEICDVVLMDIQMPVMDGIEATELFVKEKLGKVLILTTFDDYELVEKAIKCGAKGYLIKNHTSDQLKQMICSIYHGVNVIDPLSHWYPFVVVVSAFSEHHNFYDRCLKAEPLPLDLVHLIDMFCNH